jgi:hypothetical protein
VDVSQRQFAKRGGVKKAEQSVQKKKAEQYR